MLYFSDRIATRVSDKVTCKDYVREKLGEGYTAKLYGVWDNVDDIDFSVLPLPYVLKSNCSSDDKNMLIITEPVGDEKAMREVLRPWLDWRNTDICGYGHAYYSITPKILAEEYLGNEKERMLTDYKFFCFNGVPFCVYSDYRPRHFAFYDLEWNVLDIKYGGRDIYPIPKPPHFDDMLHAAEILSEGFPFVRVDFFDLADGFKVGELTYDSAGGMSTFTPESFDSEMGEKFILSTTLLSN